MRWRIAHVTATFPPYLAGTGLVAYHNAAELARRGHEAHVFTAAQAGAPAEETVDGVRVHRLRPVFRVGNAPLLPQLPNALRGFDLVHLHYPFITGAEFVGYAARRERTPLILSFHNDLIGQGGRAALFRHYQRLSARLTVRRADALAVVSRDHYESTALAASLGRRAPRVVELPNGVDVHAFSPGDGAAVRARHGIPPAAPLGLFVAALDRAHHFKGLERLLKVWATGDSPAWLLIAGDGELRPAYEALCGALGIAGRVVFAGKVANRDLPPYYRAADVTVFPTAPPESFGLVLLESLACATPVIASNLPGVRTVVADGVDGYLVAPGDPADLARRLDHLLNLPDEARRVMGQAGRRKVEARYSWERIGDCLETLYAELPGVATRRTLMEASR